MPKSSDGASVDPDASLEPDTSEGGWFRRLWRWLFPTPVVAATVLAVCFIAPAVLLWSWIEHNPKISPIDEGVHLDYVIRAQRGEIPRTGEYVTDKAARIVACTRVDLEGLPLPDCDDPNLRAQDFPGGGFNYEAQQPPLYYAATALLQPVVRFVSGEDNYLTSTRYTGYVWLSLGLLCLWGAGRAFKVPPWAMVAVLVLLMCTPHLVYYSSVVSNDAPSLLMGSGILLAVGLALQQRTLTRRWVIGLGVLSAVAALVKTTDAFAAGALALFVAWALYTESGDRRAALRRWLPIGGALVGGAIVGTLVWQVTRTSIQLFDASQLPTSLGYPLRGGARLGEFTQNLTFFFGLATDAAPSRWLSDSLLNPFVTLVKTLLLVAAFLGLFVRPQQWFHRLGLSTLVVMIVGSLALAIGFWVTFGQNPHTEARYGLPLAPLLAVSLAGAVGAVKDRRLTIGFGVTAGLYLAASIAVLA